MFYLLKSYQFCELPKLLVYLEEENGIPHHVHKEETETLLSSEKCENEY